MTQVAETLDAPLSGQPPAQQGDSPSPDQQGQTWLNSVLGRTPVELPAPVASGEEDRSESGESQDTEGAAPAEPQPKADGEDSGAPDGDAPIALTRAQLTEMIRNGITQFEQTELPRRLQAEVDRREAKRAKEEQRRTLRQKADNDPYAASEELKKMLDSEDEMQTTQAMRMQIYGGALAEFDAAVLDQVTAALPKAEATRLIQKGVNTVPQRREFVMEGLKILRAEAIKEGAALAREQLKKDPAFKKESLAELRASRGVAEPEVLEGTPADNGPRDSATIMNTLIRGFAGRR
jgi:hypothetical protein